MPKSLTIITMTAVMWTGIAAVDAPTVEAQSAGVIEGHVRFQSAPPPRRSANRYPGGRAGTHQIQPLPGVAYLVGPVRGAPAARSGDSPSMTQRDTMFIPSVVFVRTGGSVAFPNGDPFQHNVYSYSSVQTFDLGRQNPETTASRTFAEPGIVEVFCEVHDFMRGAIVVTENPFAATIDEAGTFRITGIPPGEYTIAFWHPDHRPLRQTVVVTPGGRAIVEVELER